MQAAAEKAVTEELDAKGAKYGVTQGALITRARLASLADLPAGADARHAVEIILALYESARRGGERISLPLAADTPAVGFPSPKKRK